MRLSAFKSLAKGRLAQRIAVGLESAIKEGRMLPGERLASERALSEQLGVSRPVLREALRDLKERGFLDIRPGLGTFVRGSPAGLQSAPPREWLVANLSQVHAFYEARLVIEPSCAGLAAERHTQEQLVALKQIAQHSERVISQERIVAFIGLDIDFHTAVARMSGNSLLQRMLETIINPETDLRRVLHRIPGHPPVAQARHNRIVRAIEARDPQGAREAMSSALRSTLDDIERLAKGGDA